MSDTTAFLYLVAGVLFILALRGLSSPDTARKGNLYGMIGMGIAILNTLALPGVQGYGPILLTIAIGGSVLCAGYLWYRDARRDSDGEPD